MKKAIFASVIILILFSAVRAFSETVTWSVSSGVWNNSSNWSPPKVPSTADSVVLTGTGTIRLDSDVRINALTIGTGITLNLNAGVLSISTPNNPPVIVSGPSAASQKVPTYLRQLLSVTASDTDGPDAISYQWSKISGPGNISFSDPDVANTEVSLDAAGDYVVQVTCSDGSDTVSGNVSITAYGPTTDWRTSAFNRSQKANYNSIIPSSCENVAELILPVPGSNIGLTFTEYSELGSRNIYDDHASWAVTLGPCGASHNKSVEFSIGGDVQPYTDVFDWTKPEPDVPIDKRPSTYGLSMIYHRYELTSSYPGFVALDHYGIRPMPLCNDGAQLGTTFRITGYKVAQEGETFPQISKVNFETFTPDGVTLLLDITHPRYEASAMLLIGVTSNGPTVIDIGMVIYPRVEIPVGELGVWTFSSMNWKDTDPNDYAADSDTLVYGTETEPSSMDINNPSSGTTISSLGSIEFAELKIVNGRTAAPNSIHALAKYWTRPDSLLTIFGDRNALQWDLTVSSTNYEGEDNLVLTGRNESILTASPSVDDGYVFLSQLRSERPSYPGD